MPNNILLLYIVCKLTSYNNSFVQENQRLSAFIIITSCYMKIIFLILCEIKIEYILDEKIIKSLFEHYLVFSVLLKLSGDKLPVMLEIASKFLI